MPTVFGDSLHIGELTYTIYGSPLEPFLATLPARPTFIRSPFTVHGYRATWGINEGRLYLEDISSGVLKELFAGASFPVRASWFSGLLHGYLGEKRCTGWPPRTFYNDEIVSEIVAGNVVREWELDLNSVPGQTDDELRLALPSFLWSARLREGAGE